MLGPHLDVAQHPFVGQVVVVAGVAQDDQGGAPVHAAEVVAVKCAKCPAEIRMGEDVDNVARQRLFDRLLRVSLFEELRDLPDLADEDEAAHARIQVLERVDELQHEARHIAHRIRDIAEHDHLRLVAHPPIELKLERHAAVLQVLP